MVSALFYSTDVERLQIRRLQGKTETSYLVFVTH